MMAVDLLQKIFPSISDIANGDEKKQTNSGLSGRRVMVVDDDEDFRFLVSERLESRGMICFEAENGEVAKELLKGQHVDLVITDNHMPVMNGLELIEWLQETQSYMPVILVSGDISFSVREKAQKAGVDVCVEKPCSLAQLSSKVEEVLNVI
jgi:CheY-like chemotaxis protein